MEPDRGGDVVGTGSFPQCLERLEALGHLLGRALAFLVGELQPGDPFGLLDHLRRDLACLHGLGGQGPSKRLGPQPEGRQPFQDRPPPEAR